MLRQGLRLVQDPPTDNALVESFNGRLRDECLNANWFLSGRREEQDQDVAAALQREPSSHRPGVANAPGIRPGGGPVARRMSDVPPSLWSGVSASFPVV